MQFETEFGVQELTWLEQRGVIGGEGLWEMTGMDLWSAIVTAALNVFESFFTDYEPNRYTDNLDGLVGFSGGG